MSGGYTCQDCNRRAIVSSVNRGVWFNGVSGHSILVNPGTLVYADADGVVVIPPKVEDHLTHELHRIIKTERNIIFVL